MTTNKELVRAGQSMMMIDSGLPFEMPTGLDQLEDIAKSLVGAKDKTDAQLSFALCALVHTGRHVDRGYDTFQLYVEKELGYSAAKASGLIRGWEDFQSLELNPSLLSSISWTKFRALGPAISRGAITTENIAEWLPKIATDGDHALRVADITSQVKLLLADSVQALAEPGDRQNMTFQVPATQMQEVERNLEVVKEKFGQSTGGEGTMMSRLLEFAAAVSVDEAVPSFKVGGILNLKNNIERLAPGFTVILVPTENEAVLEDKAIIPATQVFSDGEAFVIATDIDDARRMLGTEDVTAYPLGVSSSFNVEEIPDVVADIVSSLPAPEDIPKQEWSATIKKMSNQLLEVDPVAQLDFQDFRATWTPKDLKDEFERTYNWMADRANAVNLEIKL